MRTALRRTLVAAAVGVAALVSATVPSAAITGGTEDTANTYSNVGLIVFYQPDGRFRCSGTLVAPQVVLTAAHCTYLDIGKVAISFDPVIARTPDEAERDVPRAADDSGPDDAVSEIGFTEADVTAPGYEGEQAWVLGTPLTHPDYSDFTDLDNWNDTGVIILDEPVALPTSPLPPENYLDQFAQPALNSTEFLTVGYGTEVRQPETGPQQPVPQRLPIVRRYTTEVGQKLTDQVLQLNGNEHDPRAGGGTCFGDTSYGYTDNCRYLGGYQRVDIPVVRDWLLDCMADLACATKA